MRIEDKTYKQNELEQEINNFQVKDPEHIVRNNIFRRIGEYELEADIYTIKNQQIANYLKNKINKYINKINKSQ